MKPTHRTLLGILALFTYTSVVRAADTSQVTDRLHRAEMLNRIDDPSLKPWHLKVSFQLFDTKGQPSERGTIEEWWRSPSQYKTVYSSPSYTSTEIMTPEGLYRSKNVSSAPYFLALVLQEIVHPLSSEDIAESTPELRKVNVEKVLLDCIMLSQPIKRVAYPPLGLFPTYCFDRDSNSLRAGVNFGTQLSIRNGIGSFQQRIVPLTQSIRLNSVDAITFHVEMLRVESPPDAEFAPSNDLEKTPPDVAYVAADVMGGLIQNRPQPIYPERARTSHVTGTILIRARIGIDGHVHSMKLVTVPDPDLAIAAITAVRQWTYTPYTLNGVATEVDSDITVNFKMGP